MAVFSFMGAKADAGGNPIGRWKSGIARRSE